MGFAPSFVVAAVPINHGVEDVLTKQSKPDSKLLVYGNATASHKVVKLTDRSEMASVPSHEPVMTTVYSELADNPLKLNSLLDISAADATVDD